MSADHAAEARRLAELADLSYGRIEHRNGAGGVSEGVEALIVVQTAQVHATLALVEQQRIANLIALASSYDATLASFGYDALVEFLPSADLFSPPEPVVLLEIRKGLGL